MLLQESSMLQRLALPAALSYTALQMSSILSVPSARLLVRRRPLQVLVLFSLMVYHCVDMALALDSLMKLFAGCKRRFHLTNEEISGSSLDIKRCGCPAQVISMIYEGGFPTRLMKQRRRSGA